MEELRGSGRVCKPWFLCQGLHVGVNEGENDIGSKAEVGQKHLKDDGDPTIDLPGQVGTGWLKWRLRKCARTVLGF